MNKYTLHPMQRFNLPIAMSFAQTTLPQQDENVCMRDFFRMFRQRYANHLDLEFLDQFVNWQEQQGEFIIRHNMLHTYGVMVDGIEPRKFRDRFDNLEFLEGEHYEIRQEVSTNRNRQMVDVYWLTPEAFKEALMNATTNKKHGVSSSRYRKFYIVLETMNHLYAKYQSAVSSIQEARILAEKKAAEAASKRSDSIRDSVLDKLDQLTRDVSGIKQQNDQLLDQNRDLEFKLDDNAEKAEARANHLITNLREVMNHLQVKSKNSTINPSDSTKVTHYGILVPDKFVDRQSKAWDRYVVPKGQKSYVEGVFNRYIDSHHWQEGSPFYNANSNNLMQNARKRFNQMLKNFLTNLNRPIIAHNEELKISIADHNATVMNNNIKAGLPKKYAELIAFNEAYDLHQLIEGEPRRSFKPPAGLDSYKKYVETYNKIIATKANPNYRKADPTLRGYSLECKPLITLKDIPIQFGTSIIKYRDNDYLSRDQVLTIIHDMNSDTQRSPASSEAESLIATTSSDSDA